MPYIARLHRADVSGLPKGLGKTFVTVAFAIRVNLDVFGFLAYFVFRACCSIAHYSIIQHVQQFPRKNTTAAAHHVTVV